MGTGVPKQPRHRILECDRDLVAALDDDAAALASQHATAPVELVPEGRWTPRFEGDLTGALGVLLLDGLIARTVTVAGRPSTEILVSGDLLRPWQQDSDMGLVRSSVGWHVLEPARLALLDRRFAFAAGRWPEVIAEIAARGLRRSRGQALSAAIARISPVEMRLLALFWHLADRVGRVSPEGIVVPVALTHETLAEVVSARRPSVTTALSALGRAALVLRRPDTRHWVLTHASHEAIERLWAREGTESRPGAGARAVARPTLVA